MVRLQELALVFGHTEWTEQTDGTDGQTDRRGSRNSYLDKVFFQVEAFSNENKTWSII